MAKTDNFNLFKIESNEQENIVLPKSNVINDTIMDDPTLPMGSLSYTDLKPLSQFQNNNKKNKNNFGFYYKIVSLFSII